MTDEQVPAEVVPAPPVPRAERSEREAVESPAKVMRIGSMVKQLLDEVRAAPLDEASRERLRGIFDESVQELTGVLSPDLADELNRLAPPFGDDNIPSDAQLRVAQAQLVGWLEGLFQGTQLALQMQAARALFARGGGPGGPGAGPGGPGVPGELPSGADSGQGPREQDPRYL